MMKTYIFEEGKTYGGFTVVKRTNYYVWLAIEGIELRPIKKRIYSRHDYDLNDERYAYEYLRLPSLSLEYGEIPAWI